MLEENREKKDLVSIEKMAKLCGVSVQTLRYYEEAGILAPYYKDEQTGYRYYSKENMLLWLSGIENVKSLPAPMVSIDNKECKRY